MSFAEHAIRYAEELSWRVFPLASGSKVPAVKGGHAVKDASAYRDDIVAWWGKYPKANIGLACGLPSGVIVIDVDPRNGGHETLTRFASRGHVMPYGPRARSGNGGLHYFLRFDKRIANSKNRLGPGIDVKSTGGYVVAAPSWIAPSKSGKGGSYNWEVSPFDAPVPRIPIWVMSILAPPPKPRQVFEPKSCGSADVETLANWVARASVGERSNRLHWAACRVGEMVARHKVSDRSAGHRLVSAAVATGLTRKEAIGTVDSGYKKSGLRFEP